MKLSMWMLADWLREYRPQLRIREGKRVLRNVRLFSSDMRMEAMDAYVGPMGDFIDGEGSQVICVHGHDMILLETEDINQIFNEILDGQDVFCAKLQIGDAGAAAGEGGDQKIAQHIVPLDHGERAVKKFRQDNKIHGNIVLTCGQDLLGGRLTEKKQVAGLKDDTVGVIDNMRSGTGAHIHHLHVVMAVFWKMSEARVRADLDQTSLGKKPFIVYHEIFF